jgi:hypothetical protein
MVVRPGMKPREKRAAATRGEPKKGVYICLLTISVVLAQVFFLLLLLAVAFAFDFWCKHTHVPLPTRAKKWVLARALNSANIAALRLVTKDKTNAQFHSNSKKKKPKRSLPLFARALVVQQHAATTPPRHPDNCLTTPDNEGVFEYENYHSTQIPPPLRTCPLPQTASYVSLAD